MKRLFIDLEKCTEDKDSAIKCEYFYHPGNNGIAAVWELANFALVCRKCDDAPCAASCPFEALERQENNIMRRYSMRCTSCKTCAQACPFGTIYPETIPYLLSRCDICVGKLKENQLPKCVSSRDHDGIQYGDFDENEDEEMYKLTENIIIRSEHWKRAVPAKKK
ncbi:MAG: 4Fe-4S dicluster domain-containing protein [Candidatus Omnitrophota bacterium]